MASASTRTTMSNTQTVFIVGGTGKTGSSIIDALLSDPKFHVIAAVRPASASKPAVEALKSRGAEIRIVDLETDSDSQPQEHLKGVDVVISAIDSAQLSLQDRLIRASKQVGVKRFVPCDWASACVPGARALFDEKLKYHDLIKELGLGYTFIDVGWWHQVSVPILDPAKEPYPGVADMSKTTFGTGDVKTALTDLRDIGKFVARILTDERTLNRYVFCWAEQRTQKEIFALAERVSGQSINTKQMTAEDMEAMISGVGRDSLERHMFEYIYSIYVRGDNTIENAKKEEYGSALDARELYPDFKPRTLEAFAKEYYLQ